jgi:small-conductance mechanosensitive channel
MGIGDRMKGFANNMQDGAKNTSISLFHILLRLVTGVLLGLTLALIGQELVGYGSFALMFVMITVVAIVYKLLVAMLLRMYILVAP